MPAASPTSLVCTLPDITGASADKLGSVVVAVVLQGTGAPTVPAWPLFSLTLGAPGAAVVHDTALGQVPMG